MKTTERLRRIAQMLPGIGQRVIGWAKGS